MELVYRVLWQDDQNDLISSVQDTFVTWSGEGDYEFVQVEDKGLEVKEIRKTGLEGSRISVRVINYLANQYVWLDAESETHETGLASLEAIKNLTRLLIGTSERCNGRPRRGISEFHLLLPKPTDENIFHFVNQIFSSERPVAIICVAHDPLREKGKTISMAHALAEDYAGVTQVLYLGPGELAKFQNLVGSSLSLEPGEVRIYPPSEVEFRTVLAAPPIPASDIRKSSYDSIHRRVLRTIQPYMLALSLPENCEEALRLLRGFSDPKDLRRLQRKNTDFEDLLEENQKLRRSFRDVSADLEHAIEEIEGLQDLIRVKDIQRREAEEWWIERTDALEASQAEAEQKRLDMERRAISFAMHENVQNFRDEETQSIDSVAEALERGRELLDLVAIPKDVSLRLEDMDNNQRSKTWGRDIWKAFLAFEAYARTRYSGNFYQWCSSGSDFSWYAQGTALKESDNVRTDERLYQQRVLPVSHEVSQSGKIFMEAHLKFRGNMAPRLYFYDDTKGMTGKIHVGGIDPHSRWENTTT
ncbi:MAG: hypothetical protein VYD77_03195 [Actinomycetota bacterium]|nr:hypothetical protein [Actinomycetota bacterium]